MLDDDEEKFDWNSEEQGLVLASFFYGYCVTQVAGGWLADQYSPVLLYGIGVGGTSLLSLLTPLSTKLGIWGIVTIRGVMGLLSGVAMPAPSALFSRWAPPDERGKLAGLAFSGGIFGIIIAMPLSGLLIEYFGWKGMFYIMGGGCSIWIPIWFLFARNSPQEMESIHPEELKYLLLGLGSSQLILILIRMVWTP